MQAAGSFVTLLLAVTLKGKCPFEECVVAGGSEDLHKVWKESLQAQGVRYYTFTCAKKAHMVQIMETGVIMPIYSFWV